MELVACRFKHSSGESTCVHGSQISYIFGLLCTMKGIHTLNTPGDAPPLQADHTCVGCLLPELDPREDVGAKGC